MRIIIYIGVHAFAAYVLCMMVSFIIDGLIWFPALFLGMYLVILFIISMLFWLPLHRAFPARPDKKLKRHIMVNATFGVCRFVVNATVSETGLRLAAIPLYRLFHPPIHIPWSAIDVTFPKPRVTRLSFKERDFPDIHLQRKLVIEKELTGP